MEGEIFQVNTQPKVLCLIGHGYYKPWIDIAINGQNKTWLAHELPVNFKVLNYHGSPLNAFGRLLDSAHERIRWSRRFFHLILKSVDLIVTSPFLAWIPKTSKSKLLHLNHETVHVHVLDAYLTMRWKAKGVFRYALENFDFDYIFITTTSSYIRPERLLESLEDQPRTRFLGGARAYDGANFAAGSNRVISRDLVEYLVKSPTSYLPHLIEDVSLSKSLIRKGVSIKFFPHLDVSSKLVLEGLTDEELLSNYHFRLKSGSLKERADVQLMVELERRIANIDGLGERKL